MIAIEILFALLLGWLCPTQGHWHPQHRFERLAAWLEPRVHAADRWRGALIVAGLVLPPVLLAAEIVAKLSGIPGFWGTAFSILALAFTLDLRCVRALDSSQGADAATDPSAVCASVLKNGNDKLFGVLFWFLVAGAPGAILYRLASTLNTLWGHMTPRYLEFGWAAAQLDDMLGIVPARLSALSYALLGSTRRALDCWREQAPTWHDPNAGPLLAAGAGALGIRLGGGEQPFLGTDTAPAAADIERARKLVRMGILLWLLVIGSGAAAWWWLQAYATEHALGWGDLFNFLWEKLLA